MWSSSLPQCNMKLDRQEAESIANRLAIMGVRSYYASAKSELPKENQDGCSVVVQNQYHRDRYYVFYPWAGRWQAEEHDGKGNYLVFNYEVDAINVSDVAREQAFAILRVLARRLIGNIQPITPKERDSKSLRERFTEGAASA